MWLHMLPSGTFLTALDEDLGSLCMGIEPKGWSSPPSQSTDMLLTVLFFDIPQAWALSPLRVGGRRSEI